MCSSPTYRVAHEMIQYLSINKIFISITIPETNIQKERPLHGDLSSVNQVLNMTTITFDNFNKNCDVVDYSTAHILSYLVAGLND
jgi:D-ribose pyranose/furanose isomerase RbsD